MKTNSQKSIHLAFSITIIISLLGLITLVALTSHSKQQLLNLFGERSSAIATFTISEVDRSVHNNIATVKDLNKTLATEETLAESNEEFAEIDDLQTYINRTESEWAKTASIEENELMESLINNPISARLRESYNTSRLSSTGNSYLPFGEIFLTNAYGFNIAQTNRTSDYYQADEEWWQIAKENGIHINDVAFDDSANTYSIDISMAITDSNGAFLGVTKVVWNIEEIIELLRITELERREKRIFGESSRLTLLNTDGKIIYQTSNSENFFRDINPLLQETITTATNQDELYTIVENPITNTTSFITYAQSTGFGNFEGLNWILIFEQDTNEILAPLKSNQIVIAIILLLFIGTAISLNYVYTRHIQEIQKNKEEFIAMTSHELKRPLTNIDASLDMLAGIQLPAESAEWLQAIKTEKHQMLNLVQDLLSVAQLESGKLEIKTALIEINETTEFSLKNHEEKAKEKQQTLKLQKLPHEEKVMLDNHIYGLIVGNLISNAIKYSGNQTTINVGLQKSEQGYLIAVADQGIGIPLNEQPKIFTKFYRADNAVKSNVPGTGLGLYMMSQIVTSLGGKIWFKSKQNQGTTFYVLLPLQGMKPGKLNVSA